MFQEIGPLGAEPRISRCCLRASQKGCVSGVGLGSGLAAPAIVCSLEFDCQSLAGYGSWVKVAGKRSLPMV